MNTNELRERIEATQLNLYKSKTQLKEYRAVLRKMEAYCSTYGCVVPSEMWTEADRVVADVHMYERHLAQLKKAYKLAEAYEKAMEEVGA